MSSNIAALLLVVVASVLALHLVKAFAPTPSGGLNNQNHLISRLNKHLKELSTSSLHMSPPNRSRNGFSTRRAPLKFLRIRPRRSRNNKQRTFELQTAVATLAKKLDDGSEIVVDLHAQLHFGEKGYFQFYNEKSFDEKYDNVFYELIVANNLLHTEKDGTRRLLPVTPSSSRTNNPNPISPPPTDESTASSYGLTCQINAVDYTKANWIHCDVTREEYLSFLSSSSAPSSWQPIWALSSTSMSPIQEYAAALVRPSTPSSARKSISQFSSTRLFSNLFLPGANLASVLRILLWILSPSPEVSILLLDWSSIVNPKPSGTISPIFVPCLESLLSGNLLNARKLVFAQLLVSGQTAGGQDLNLVRRRNSVALSTLTKKIESPPTITRKNHGSYESTNAILYGAMHCQDLQSRLEKMGFGLKKVEWRKAWSVNVPSFGTGQSLLTRRRRSSQAGRIRNPLFESDFVTANSINDIAVGLVVVPIYLLIGGLDWIGTVRDLAQSIDQSSWDEAVAVATFYILRHLALYMGLAKFVVEWDGEPNLFNENI